MKIFDLHCDTIEALKNNNETFDNSITQFTMKGQEKLDKAVQFLAASMGAGSFKRPGSSRFYQRIL